MKALLELAGLTRVITIELADLKEERRIALRENQSFLIYNIEGAKINKKFKQLIFRYRGRTKKCPCCETELPVFEFVKME